MRQGRDHSKQPPLRKQEEQNNSSLIPNNNTETAFTERLFVPLEECRVIKWSLTALHKKAIDEIT